eukprot:1195082-Prorocentrum_minimum.AAC.14
MISNNGGRYARTIVWGSPQRLWITRRHLCGNTTTQFRTVNVVFYLQIGIVQLRNTQSVFPHILCPVSRVHNVIVHNRQKPIEPIGLALVLDQPLLSQRTLPGRCGGSAHQTTAVTALTALNPETLANPTRAGTHARHHRKLCGPGAHARSTAGFGEGCHTGIPLTNDRCCVEARKGFNNTSNNTQRSVFVTAFVRGIDPTCGRVIILCEDVPL